MKNLRIFFTLILSASMLLSGCGSQSFLDSQTAEENTIYIGLAVPLTGPMAAIGKMAQQSAQMGTDRVNAEGGINGKNLKLVILDDANDPKQAAIVAQRFCEDSKITAVIGHITSTTTNAAYSIYQAANMPLLSPTANASSIKGYNKFLRIVLTDVIQAPQIAAMGINNLDLQTFSIIYANNEYGKNMKDICNDFIKSQNCKLLDIESYVPGGDKDFSVLLTKIQKNNPEGIIICGDYNEGSLIISQAANMPGFADTYFLGDTSMIHTLFLERTPSAMEDRIYLCCGYNPFDERSANQAFLNSFSKIYTGEPSEANAYTYDCITIIAETLRTGATKETLIATAKEMTFTNLICDDNVQFDSDGNRTVKNMDIVVIHNGSFASAGEKVNLTNVYFQK